LRNSVVNFKKFVELFGPITPDGNRRDLLLSSVDALVGGTLVLGAGLVLNVRFVVLAGLIVFVIGMALFLLLLKSYVRGNYSQSESEFTKR